MDSVGHFAVDQPLHRIPQRLVASLRHRLGQHKQVDPHPRLLHGRVHRFEQPRPCPRRDELQYQSSTLPQECVAFAELEVRLHYLGGMREPPVVVGVLPDDSFSETISTYRRRAFDPFEEAEQLEYVSAVGLSVLAAPRVGQAGRNVRGYLLPSEEEVGRKGAFEAGRGQREVLLGVEAVGKYFPVLGGGGKTLVDFAFCEGEQQPHALRCGASVVLGSRQRNHIGRFNRGRGGLKESKGILVQSNFAQTGCSLVNQLSTIGLQLFEGAGKQSLYTLSQRKSSPILNNEAKFV